jgi:hypothetical protein
MKQLLLCGQHRHMLQLQQVPAPDINIFSATTAAQYYPTHRRDIISVSALPSYPFRKTRYLSSSYCPGSLWNTRLISRCSNAEIVLSLFFQYIHSNGIP